MLEELDIVTQFLNELPDILSRVAGLREVEMCNIPIQIFDEETLNVCYQIYHEDMEYLYRMGELDPY